MTGAAECVVIGYASVDYKYLTEPFQGEGRTTLVRHPLSITPTEPGAAYYFASALARAGTSAALVSWVGRDSRGTVFCDALTAAHVDGSGVTVTGTRSPAAYMFYADAGDLVLYFDPGDVDQSLAAQQRELIASARALLVGIGPEAATRAALLAVPDDSLVMWVVKADPVSVPPSLAQVLADRADIICYSRTEQEFLEQTCGLDLAVLARSGTVVIRTAGHEAVTCDVHPERLMIQPQECGSPRDATGAGDTFAGTLFSELLTARSLDPKTVSDAVTNACAATAHLLLTRTALCEADSTNGETHE